MAKEGEMGTKLKGGGGTINPVLGKSLLIPHPVNSNSIEFHSFNFDLPLVKLCVKEVK